MTKEEQFLWDEVGVTPQTHSDIDDMIPTINGGIKISNLLKKYADQQTKDKDKEIEELKGIIHEHPADLHREYNNGVEDSLEEITQLKTQLKEKSEEVERLKENLNNQIITVVKEHPIEVVKDTYWRGVKIGLETSLNLLNNQ